MECGNSYRNAMTYRLFSQSKYYLNVVISLAKYEEQISFHSPIPEKKKCRMCPFLYAVIKVKSLSVSDAFNLCLS